MHRHEIMRIIDIAILDGLQDLTVIIDRIIFALRIKRDLNIFRY